MAPRILIADDHQLLRAGLRSLLEEQGFEVIGESENGRGAVNLVRKLKPDVLIIDINMPILNGIEATRLLRKQAPDVKVLVLSMLSDSRSIFQALAAGASGYLLKDAAFDEMILALKAVVRGQTFLSPAIAHVVVQNALASAPASVWKCCSISGREREVLQLVAEGRPTREIAAVLFISVKTVETHRKQIMDKLNVRSIAELTKYAVREGVTSL
jgi:DNA-binding NarL/FixJ family response regulator